MKICNFNNSLHVFCEKAAYMSSRETQEYWKKTGYTPSVAECAWLIKQDRSLRLEEQHKAWTEIIATMPDCAFISEDYPDANIDSVHAFLAEYMDFENRLFARFYKKESNAVYTYKFWCDEDQGWIGSDGPLYVNFEEALAVMGFENRLFARFHKKESNAVYTYKVWCDEDQGWIGSDGPLYVNFEEALAEFKDDADLSPRLALFTKVYFGAEHERLYIYMRPDGAVMRVAEDLLTLEEYEYKIFYEVFYGMELAFKDKTEDEK